MQDLLDLVDRALDEAGLVGVLDAEDEGAVAALALGLAVGEELVEEGGAAAADVERAGRAGRKADANRRASIHESSPPMRITGGQSRSPGTHRGEV